MHVESLITRSKEKQTTGRAKNYATAVLFVTRCRNSKKKFLDFEDESLAIRPLRPVARLVHLD